MVKNFALTMVKTGKFTGKKRCEAHKFEPTTSLQANDVDTDAKYVITWVITY